LIPKQNAFFKYLVTQTLKNSAIVTADSQDMIEAMKALYPQGNYKLLQYGIDPIQALEKEKIIYSNRLHEPLYRIEKVIEYFKQFSAQHPDWKLVIAGTGSQTEHLKSLVSENNLDSKTSFVGWQKKPENSAWYAKSSIYISIPTSDGTSVSVLEAMSAGCIPVVSDLPVSHEWIVSSKNGIIEKSGENPLLKALEIDREICSKLNTDLIHQKATRAASIKESIGFYKSINIK
jgi:glycosyltransferase involved in cell wall biosynthesis